MPRLPQPGSDDGTWGQVLNTFLTESHNADGSIKSGAVGAGAIQDGTVTAAKLSVSGGSDGQMLTKDSGSPGGLAWAATGGGSSTLGVTDGGTGRVTGGTAYGLIAAGATATGVQQTIAPGTTGQFLKSGGGAALAGFASIAESDVANLTADLAAKAPLADTPRYLRFSSGWPARPADSRMTIFLGGSASTDQPDNLNLQTGDIWIPSS